MTTDIQLKGTDQCSEASAFSGILKPNDLTEKRKTVKFSYSQTRKVELKEKTLTDNRIVSGIKNEEAVAAYKILRTRLLQKLKAHKWNTFGITSARSGQGVTLSAINTAMTLAQEHTHTVLLVDFNFKKPAICSTLGIQPQFGIEDYLFEELPLDKILINPDIEKLVILPCKEPIIDASELMNSPRVVEMVDELKSRYPNRIVIFDLPSVLEGDEVISFSSYIDALLLVVQENHTTKEDIGLMAELLKGVPILGSVLNKGA